MTILKLQEGYQPPIECICHRRELCGKCIGCVFDKDFLIICTLIARFLYGPKYRTWTTERTFDGSAICRALDYTTTPVCEYLRTHVYDEQSL